MDADKRHQLKSNELAEALDKLRQLNEPKTLMTLAAIGVVVVVFLAIYAWRSAQARAKEEQWQRLISSVAAASSGEDAQALPAMDDLREMTQDSKDPVIAGYARLMLAAARVDQAISHPQERAQALAEARDTLEPLAGDGSLPAALQAAASFTLASAYESLRDFDRARALYEALAQDPRFAAFGYRKLADQRLQDFPRLAAAVTFSPGMPPPGTAAAPAQPGAPSAIDQETLRRVLSGKQSVESILPQTQPAPAAQPGAGASPGQPAPPEAPAAAPPPAETGAPAPTQPPAATEPAGGQGDATGQP